MDKAFARQFTADWIESWNAHDLDRVLSHYADDFKMSSPVIHSGHWRTLWKAMQKGVCRQVLEQSLTAHSRSAL